MSRIIAHIVQTGINLQVFLIYIYTKLVNKSQQKTVHKTKGKLNEDHKAYVCHLIECCGRPLLDSIRCGIGHDKFVEIGGQFILADFFITWCIRQLDDFKILRPDLQAKKKFNSSKTELQIQF